MSKYPPPEFLKSSFGHHLVDGHHVPIRKIGVLVELGVQPLNLLEQIDELAARCIVLEIGNLLRRTDQAWLLHEVIKGLYRSFQLVDGYRCGVDQPDFPHSLADLMCSGREIWNSAAPKCQSKSAGDDQPG